MASGFAAVENVSTTCMLYPPTPSIVHYSGEQEGEDNRCVLDHHGCLPQFLESHVTGNYVGHG